MNLDLSEDEAAALVRLLRNAIDGDRDQFSPRIMELKGILGKLRHERPREPLPSPEARRAAGARADIGGGAKP